MEGFKDCEPATLIPSPSLFTHMDTIHTSITTDQRASHLQITKPCCTDQRVIIVIKGETSSVEYCIWSERASQLTSILGFTV